ncbi:hypothetical protein OHB41_07835 [Streptomyces sp. NBC_01571]|nr:hypothetical protein [Streptomyces sp. NBC_01571]MCX4573096.1 hypothetical protein [Streptomyces sp. NBC_01571]
MSDTFQDRMFMGAEAVREAYERGEIQGAAAVEAALMQAQVDASQED